MNPTLNLAFRPCVVSAVRPPDNQPGIAMSFLPDSPVGPCVGLGVAASLPGQPGLAFIAHMHPDEADDLIAQLQEASAAARQALGGGELRIPPKLAESALEAWGDKPEGPAVVAILRNDDGEIEAAAPVHEVDADFLQGEAMGLQIQVQHEGDGEPSLKPGAIAFIVHRVPGHGRPILGIHIRHGDGSGIAGLLEEEQIEPTIGLFGQAALDWKAVRDGTPEGVTRQ